jgi:hypothetical protein
MIFDPNGNLVWFEPFPVSQNTLVTDFRVQQLDGQLVLAWWQGNTNSGHGPGEGVVLNRDYQQIATVKAGKRARRGAARVLGRPAGGRVHHRHLPGPPARRR